MLVLLSKTRSYLVDFINEDDQLFSQVLLIGFRNNLMETMRTWKVLDESFLSTAGKWTDLLRHCFPSVSAWQVSDINWEALAAEIISRRNSRVMSCRVKRSHISTRLIVLIVIVAVVANDLIMGFLKKIVGPILVYRSATFTVARHIGVVAKLPFTVRIKRSSVNTMEE
ncbi:hypothetical protein C5167_044826 [Papaver somniferum]|nr:hypothetical protein C5167_044826 [Papaver somniferum]